MFYIYLYLYVICVVLEKVERYDKGYNTDDEDWDYSDEEDESSNDSGVVIKKKKAYSTVDDGDKDIYLQRLQEWQDSRTEKSNELDSKYEELDGGMRVPARYVFKHKVDDVKSIITILVTSYENNYLIFFTRKSKTFFDFGSYLEFYDSQNCVFLWSWLFQKSKNHQIEKQIDCYNFYQISDFVHKTK